MKNILILSLAIVLFAAPAFGQANKPASQVTEIEATTGDGRKVILSSNGRWKYAANAPAQDKAEFTPTPINMLSLSASVLSKGGAYGVVRAGYDEFKNESIVLSKPIVVDNAKRLDLQFVSAFFFDTDTLKAPPRHFYLYFASTSREWEFLKSNDLYFLADGQRIVLKKVDDDQDIKLDSVSEKIIFQISPTDFEKLVNAKEVRFKLGNVEGNLGRESIIAMRNILVLAGLKKLKPGEL